MVTTSKFFQCRLAEISKVKGGKRLPANAKLVSTPTLHPYIRGRDIRDGRVSFAEPSYVLDEDFEKIRRYTVDSGDVCITIVGNIGDVAIVPRHLHGASLTENAVKLVELDGRVNARFLMYALLSPEAQSQMKLSAAGAAQAKLGIYKVNEIKVPLPPLCLQVKISSILSTYDDLIENNTRRIEILEEMARRLYEEWFVQFRFPGHEGVEFTDSSLGLIPVGWTVGCLQDVITLQRGFDLPIQHRLAGSVPIISATGIGGSHVEAKVKGPGVVTGRSGSIGKVMYVHDDHWPLNTTLWGANYPLGSTLFAYYVLSSIDLKGFNVGAAVPTLNRNDIHGLPVSIPPKEIVQSFEEVAEPLHNLTEKLLRKNANLRAQRDLLLPKLISGEIDVSDIPMPT